MHLAVCVVLLLCFGIAGGKRKPNIVLIITDDEDLALFESSTGRRRSDLVWSGRSLHGLVTTPLCCPSRASILTGLYAHNTGVTGNARIRGCADEKWKAGLETKTFAVPLQKAGYRTFYAGKYLNQYGRHEDPYVPPGWDSWFGLIGNSVYFNYSLYENGRRIEYGDSERDYLPEVIWRKASDFLANQHHELVFGLILVSLRWNVRQKVASYNGNGSGKHWLVRQAPSPMNAKVAAEVDAAYRNRKRTLLSIDDLVGNLLDKLEAEGKLNSTYILYTSDNGFHTGQFSLPLDKRQMYDFDLRVPMFIRGPGIPPNTSANEQVLSIDIAPTLLELGGLAARGMDGRSFLPLLFHTHSHRRRRLLSCFLCFITN